MNLHHLAKSTNRAYMYASMVVLMTCSPYGAGRLPDPQGGAGGESSEQIDRPAPVGPDYCDVQPIFSEKCLRCHSGSLFHDAPFSLESHADFLVLRGTSETPTYELIGRAVKSDFMPPTWLSDVMPPIEALSQEEKDLIFVWVDAGAKGPALGDCSP